MTLQLKNEFVCQVCGKPYTPKPMDLACSHACHECVYNNLLTTLHPHEKIE